MSRVQDGKKTQARSREILAYALAAEEEEIGARNVQVGNDEAHARAADEAHARAAD